ncbi:MAG TPA: methyltransferase [Candidatus Binataceae bacterium]|nr:methyltransferase [Candidatus Binataceae bacterium]
MSEDRIDSVRLQNLAYGYRQSATLVAAIELGLFTKIAGGATTIDALAAALGVTRPNAERLLTACAALGLVTGEGGNFRNAPDVERFLVDGARTYAGPWLTTMGRSDYAAWNKLAQYLRSQEPPRVLGTYENFSVEDARKLHAATFSIGMGAGRRFARQCDLSQRTKILDLGGGSGCYCIAAAQQYPNLRAVVFDLPSVAIVAREYIARHGFSDRISAVGGDFTRDPFPAGADVAILASNLPQYSPAIIRTVVAKAFAALVPGGEMHVIGEMLNDQRTGPLGPALWGLNEALYNSTGVAHSESDTAGYLRDAGFIEVLACEFIPGSLTRVTGRTPARQA